MAELENKEYLKLKNIGRKDRISKVDLEKINMVLNMNILLEQELNSLLADSLIAQNRDISDLLFNKISDISCEFVQNQFLMYCLFPSVETVEYILSKGFVITPDYYSKLMQSRNKLSNEIIELVDNQIRDLKVRYMKSKINKA